MRSDGPLPDPAGAAHRTVIPRVLRVLHLTDSHLLPEPGGLLYGMDTEALLAALLDQIMRNDPIYDLALLTGDLADEPSVNVYARLAEHLHALPMPALCLPGNHDDPAEMASALADSRLSIAAALPLGDWEIVTLDSSEPGESGGYLAPEQIERLTRAAHQDPKPHRLIAVHHHPVPCGSPWMDRMMVRNPGALMDALATPGLNARAVVFGHIHQPLDLLLNGVRFLGSPATCRQFEPRTEQFRQSDLPPGYRWLELHPDGRIETGIRYLSR